MAINILVESHFKDSIWCRQLLKSIIDEATARRYEVNIISSDEVDQTDFDAIFHDSTERRLLFCICDTLKILSQANSLIQHKNIHLVLINHTFFNPIEKHSCISMDFSGAVKNIIDYLNTSGRDKIALYGVNPSSTTDLIKQITFNDCMKSRNPEYNGDSVFYNKASLKECFESFLPRISEYNAIVCANDIVAISLLNMMKEIGLRVPQDYFVISFGDTILSKIYSPTLTNVSVNLSAIGEQSVYLYSYLKKREAYVSASIAIHSSLFIRESTNGFSAEAEASSDYLPFGDDSIPTQEASSTSNHTYSQKSSFYHNINFYDDPFATEILKVEDLLCSLNKFDVDILASLLNRESTAHIAETLYSSQQSISYRIKRMCQVIGCDNKTQLLETLSKYVSSDGLKAYKPNPEYRI